VYHIENGEPVLNSCIPVADRQSGTNPGGTGYFKFWLTNGECPQFEQKKITVENDLVKEFYDNPNKKSELN
jgi:hypothetical protein